MVKKLVFWMLAAGLIAAGLAVAAPLADETALIANLAERGSASAQVLLAGLYLRGAGGLARDDRLAAYWFEQAAIAGNGYAERMLGELYEDGRGVPHNLKLAADWREKAALRGDVKAQLALGKMYLDGRGVPRDAGRAAEWLTRAAAAGDAEAQFLLGRLRLSGEGVAKSRVQAGDWLGRAAAQGYEGAIRLLHSIEHLGWQAEEELHQGAPALEQLARDGDAEAAYQLANRLETGTAGVARDPARAVGWFREAAEHGHAGAMRALAHICRAGLYGTKADAARAEYWRRRAETAVR
jgi:hypothetical protein